MAGPITGLDGTLTDLQQFADDVGALVGPMGLVTAAASAQEAKHRPTRSRIVGTPVATAGRTTVTYAGVFAPDRFTSAVVAELAPAATRAVANGISTLVAQKGLS